jgi:hypothetical protein
MDRGGMRNDTDPTDVRVEPDVIQLGPEDSMESLNRGTGSVARSAERAARLRRFVEPGLSVAGAGLMLLAVQATGGVAPPAASPAPVGPAAVRTSAGPSRLLAPQAAVPGDRITVLAYRDRRLCGAAELRLDGAPVSYRLAGYVGSPNPGRMEMFLSVVVPRSATPGNHEIELYGPVPGGRSGPLCADVPEHQARLATTSITVGSRRG